jgi:hypothetical protein
MCARVGNQQSRGVVTARVRIDAVQRLRHQCRDLYQSTYPYLSEDRDLFYYQNGCLLLAHPLLQVMRRWLTKCRCQMRRGDWLH